MGRATARTDLRGPAQLLDESVAAAAREIGASIRAGEVASLVGAGLSMPRGFPSWGKLIDLLLEAWQRWEPDRTLRRLSIENYRSFIRQRFTDDMQVASYLRQAIAQREQDRRDGRLRRGDDAQVSLGSLIYTALYTYPEGNYTPQPIDIHRHLVALFSAHPRRIWTTNYDDLLEQAGRELGLRVVPRDPGRYRASRGLAVAHLHGYLAPPDRRTGDDPDPSESATLLTIAADDFHAIAANQTGWANRELVTLFEEYRVLILGMSLADQNLRRILATQRDNNGSRPIARHCAIMRRHGSKDVKLVRVRERRHRACLVSADQQRRAYWWQYGVEIVTTPDHDTLLPFLVRLRYEGEGDARGWLWRRASTEGFGRLDPWEPTGEQQRTASRLLEDLVARIGTLYAIPRAEIVEMGIFLVEPGGEHLVLVFRGGNGKAAVAGRSRFSIDPDRPTGLAGRVFVSGDVARVPREHPLHNYNVPAGRGTSYEGIIALPLIDWESDGLPLGVLYLTTRSADGVLFRLPANRLPLPGRTELTFDNLVSDLQGAGLALLKVLRRPRR